MARNRFLDGVSSFLGDIGRARNASNLYSELSGMSDASLARRGLTRDQVASYAYKQAFGE